MRDRIMRLLDRDFDDVVQRYFSGAELEQVLFATELAEYAHQGEARDSGEPYDAHPKAVALILLAQNMRDAHAVCLALLHDVFENCAFLTREDVGRIRYHLGSEMIEDLHGISKRHASTVFELADSSSGYYQRMVHWPLRRKLVKCADRYHNMLTLAYCSPDKQARQRRSTKTYFMPMLQGELRTMNRTHDLRHIAQFFLDEFERLCRS